MWVEKYLREITVENFPKLMKNIRLHVYEFVQILSKVKEIHI